MFLTRSRWIVVAFALVSTLAFACGSDDVAPAAEVQPRATTPVFTDELNFSLLSTNGGAVNFADLRGSVPVGLFFYGGPQCDGCNDYLLAMQVSYRQFKDLGAELIAITTDPPADARTNAETLGLEFAVLTDVEGTVAARWDVMNPSEPDHASPAIVLFDSTGSEIARQTGITATQLPSVEELLRTTRESVESGTALPTPTLTPNRPTGSSGASEMLGPGVTDFLLPDAIGGGNVSLSETLGEKNVVLVFYRAFW